MTTPSSFFTNGPGNPSYIVNPKPSSFYTETAQFNLIYYGALTTAPTVDPFGNPILTGAIYYNPTNNTIYAYDGTTWHPQQAIATAIEFIIDGGGSTISTGVGGYLTVPFNCAVTSWTILSSVSGSCVLDVFRCTAANFNPPTHPAAGDTITDSNKPTLTSQAINQSFSTSSWQTLNAGDCIAINVNSATTVTRVTLSLTVFRT